MRPVQRFSTEYLRQCSGMEPEQIVRFLEDFRGLHSRVRSAKSRLISMRVPDPLLEAFKTKARLGGVPYQTQIKRLMQDWLKTT
ncbi:MAG: hypothetical protein HYX75_25075 [Acidobacteria bacterium]|nr:hypothetical protein [Acidobacteriota bacterium]